MGNIDYSSAVSLEEMDEVTATDESVEETVVVEDESGVVATVTSPEVE